MLLVSTVHLVSIRLPLHYMWSFPETCTFSFVLKSEYFNVTCTFPSVRAIVKCTLLVKN